MVIKLPTLNFSAVKKKIDLGKKYVRGAYDKLPNNIVKLLKSTDNYKPVYKIMITYPAYKNGDLVTESVIVADTSTQSALDVLKKKIGFGVSEIIGMWIDTSDSEEPDKCMVLFRIDPDLTVKSVRGEASTLDDEYFMFHETFAMHNWIDIWIGYEKVLGGSITGSDILPDQFDWNSETHLFSGRIVLIDRNWDINGDRMIISAYSAEEVFFNHATYMSEDSPKTLRIFNRDIESESVRNLKYYKDGLLELFESIMSVSQWNILKEHRREQQQESGETRQSTSSKLDYQFIVGDFYWEMIKDGIEKILNMLRSGANKDRDVNVKSGNEYPILDNYINHKIFTKDDSYKMKAPLIISSGNITLWKAIKLMLSPEYSNAAGVGFRVVKTRDFKNKVPDRLKVETGTDKHKGIFFQFFYELDVDEITEVVDKLADKNPEYNNIVPPEDIQQITFGLDVIDFEAYMDYSSSYNSFHIMTPTYKKSNLTSPDYKGGGDYIFPLEHQDIVARLAADPDKNPTAYFWEGVLQDITLFGERRFPVTKWFSFSPNDVEAIRDNLSKETKETLPINPEITKLILNPEVQINTIVGHKGISNMFKRYYFGGLEGTSLVIGNPSLKAHRILEVKDIRHGIGVGVSAGFKRDPNDLADKAFNKVKLSLRNRISNVKPFKHTHYKFDPDFIKKYFMWKTRHYFGMNSGYITKVYFTQSRSRAWRMVSRDIMGTLKQAQRIRDELM